MGFASGSKAKSIIAEVIHVQQNFILITSDITHQLKWQLITISYNMMNTFLENIHITVAYSNFYLEFNLLQR